MNNCKKFLKVCKTGNAFVGEPLVSGNERYFIVVTSFQILVCDIETLECKHELKHETSSRFKSICNYQNNREVLVSIDEEGVIIVWDLLSFKPVQQMPTKLNPVKIIGLKDDKFLIIHLESSQLVASIFSLNENRSQRLDIKVQSEVCCYSDHQGLVAFIGSKSVNFINSDTKTLVSNIKFEHQPTVVTFEESKGILTCGFKNGSILVINPQTNMILNQFHWHSNPVISLCFNSDGSSLLSGGHEGVLVIWNTYSSKTQFVPRLNSPIYSISKSSKHFFLTHSDNVIVQLDSYNFDIVRRNLQFERNKDEGSFPLLKYDNISNCLVLNNSSSCLSFYSPVRGDMIYTLEVVQQNLIGGLKEVKYDTKFHITNYHFSNNAQWLYTLDQIHDLGMGNVKCWMINPDDNTYRCEYTFNPSSKGTIKHFEIVPHENGFDRILVCDESNIISIWQPQVVEIDDKTLYIWECTNSFKMHSNVDMMTLSSESHLLALVAEDSCEVYNFQTSIIHSKTISMSGIKSLHFGVGETAHYILIVTSSKLFVYDTVSSKIITSYQLSTHFVMIQPISGIICAFVNSAQSTEIHLLDWISVKPLQVLLIPCSNVISCVVGELLLEEDRVSKYIDNVLYLMTDTQDIYYLNKKTLRLIDYHARNMQQISTNDRRFDNQENKEDPHSLVRDFESSLMEKQFLENLKITPSHLLPSPALMYKRYMNTILCTSDIKNSDFALKDSSHTSLQTSIPKVESNDTKLESQFISSLNFLFDETTNLIS